MIQTKATLGETIDSRGIGFNLEEGDILTDIIVVAEVMTTDGRKGVMVGKDPHTSWLTEIGMLTLAKNMVTDEH